MRKTYLITYDLRQPGRNYQDLYSAMKSYGTWGKINESTWLIKTSDSAVQIRDYLLFYLDHNDSLFVVKVEREAAWKNVKASNEWIKRNL